MKVVFFGTPTFAAEVLKFLLDHKVDIVAVITKPDKPQGRSGTPVNTPVKVVAQQHNLPLYQPPIVSDLAFADTLKQYNADLFVVVAYGEILKQHILDMPKMACINLHASLLPKYRGAAPIQRAIINGEKESGVTIMHMVKKMDAGDMIQIGKVEITPDMTAGELEKELCTTGSQLLLNVICNFEKGTMHATPQDHTQATLAPKVELEDCEIKWDQPTQKIHNLVRGVNPEPGAWCYVQVKGEKKRLKIRKTAIVPVQGAPGELAGEKNQLIICCQDQAISILDLQLEGKKAMPAEELLRGLPKSNFIF